MLLDIETMASSGLMPHYQPTMSTFESLMKVLSTAREKNQDSIGTLTFDTHGETIVKFTKKA